MFVTGSMSPTMVPNRTMANSKFTPVNGKSVFFSRFSMIVKLLVHGDKVFTVSSLAPNHPVPGFVLVFPFFTTGTMCCGIEKLFMCYEPPRSFYSCPLKESGGKMVLRDWHSSAGLLYT